MSLQKILKEQEDEFDKKFKFPPADPVYPYQILFRVNDDGSLSIATPKDIKQFSKDSYAKIIKAVCEELKGETRREYGEDDHFVKGYNHRVQEEQEITKSLIEIKL